MRFLLDKNFSFLVEAEGQPVTKKIDLDKNVNMVLGIQLSADNPDHLFFRGTQRIEFSGMEIYPEGTESKLLMSGIGVAPDDRYKTIGKEGIAPGNREVKVQFLDNLNPNAPFVKYKVTVYLYCDVTL